MTVMLLQNNIQYGNNNNNIAKEPPATIEQQYQQQCNTKHFDLHGSRPRLNVFSLPYAGGPPKRQGKAMNYYRLWIYTCNAVLMLSVLGFVVVATRVVLQDSRRKLIPGLNLHHPSLLYAYLALLTQCGLLQLLGCIGAIKLSERLLNAYWLLLLILLCGDAMLGVVWIFRFDTLYKELEPILKQRLRSEYGVDAEFTSTWDHLQSDHMCCGVAGPLDFSDFDRVYVNRTWVARDREPNAIVGVPLSCCTTLKEEKEEESIITEVEEIDEKPTTIKQRLLNKKHREQRSLALQQVLETCDNLNSTQQTVNYHKPGCEQKLRKWLSDAAHVLGVLGYCVLAFLKVCFLGILRYEIREMVQKIKLLQDQPPPVLLLSEPDANTHMCNHTDGAPQPASVSCNHMDAQPFPAVLKSRTPRLYANDTGNDSDTNSHCALLLDSLPGASTEAHELQDMMYVRTAQI